MNSSQPLAAVNKTSIIFTLLNSHIINNMTNSVWSDIMVMILRESKFPPLTHSPTALKLVQVILSLVKRIIDIRHEILINRCPCDAGVQL